MKKNGGRSRIRTYDPQRDSPELIRRKAELEASTTARQSEIDVIQQAIEQRRIARKTPQPPLAAPAQSPGPGWPRAALDMVNKGTSFMSDMGDATEQGVMFGFGDEFGAGIGAGVDKLLGRSPDESFGDVYRQKLAERQGGLTDFRADHPIASTWPRSPGLCRPQAWAPQRRQRQDCQPLPERSRRAALAAACTAQALLRSANGRKAQSWALPLARP